MKKLLNLSNVLLAIFLVTASSTSMADWKKVPRSQPGEHLFGISVTTPPEIFVTGVFFDMNSRLPLPQPRLYWSQDGGKLLKDIKGNLPSGLTSGVYQALFFYDTWTGFVSVAKKIYRTTNRGAKWESTDVGTSVGAIYFHDKNNGVAVGDGGFAAYSEDGGKTWTSVATGVDVSLGCVHFVNRNIGFAAGTKITQEEDLYGNGTITHYQDACVIVTKDGGKTWTKGYCTSGIGLCPIFFLKDGKTGFLAGMKPDPQQDGRRSIALLFKSSDGGQTFEDTALDVKVGKLQFIMQIDLTMSYIATMFWQDENTGHLAGSAYVISLSGMGGSDQHFYRTVDFLTFDGGKQWKKTDLGSISISMGDQPNIQSDGQVYSGQMVSLLQGYLVGENSSVWVYEYLCSSHLDCPSGYACSESKTCEPLPVFEEPESSSNDDGGSDAWELVEGGDAGQGSGGEGILIDNHPAGNGAGGGCSMSNSEKTPWFLMLLAWFATIACLRRRCA
jgi:photosystem II stability/assembly factor-like uncharacterized protein